MTEHEDQLAQYRLKLEETAALVARIRHEINNPLTGVLGQAQLLLREELSERSRKRANTARNRRGGAPQRSSDRRRTSSADFRRIRRSSEVEGQPPGVHSSRAGARRAGRSLALLGAAGPR